MITPLSKLSAKFLNPALYVIEAKHADLNHTWYAQNVCSPYARIYVIEKGSGVLTTAHTQVVLRPGSAYLVPTGLRFSYACDHTLQKLYFHINLLGRDGLDMLQKLPEIHAFELTRALRERVQAVDSSGGLIGGLLLKSVVSELLAELLETYPELMPSPAYSRVVESAIQLVQKQVSLNWRTADLAKQLFLSESTLYKHFKTEIGMTPREYVEELVFFHASLLLSQTEDSMKQISDRLGFCDQFYFARRFKERTGYTPTAYRREARRHNAL